MSRYLDTSLLVTSISSEAEAGRIQEWMRCSTEEFALSDWSLTEFSSALAVKRRTGTISAEQYEAATVWFRHFAQSEVDLVSVTRSDFRLAAELAGQWKVRAGDALHLAIANAHRFTLCTLDRDQATAGDKAGFSAILI